MWNTCTTTTALTPCTLPLPALKRYSPRSLHSRSFALVSTQVNQTVDTYVGALNPFSGKITRAVTLKAGLQVYSKIAQPAAYCSSPSPFLSG